MTFVSTQKSESSDATGNKIISLKAHYVLSLNSVLVIKVVGYAWQTESTRTGAEWQLHQINLGF